ncbi:hypothetical protein K438DRAFT_1760059 [Mycena galopus ATCC 62051]|nr:hypothetical protein K438DRAFT_1760059 [Mycena galopus ATCC 62051]
MLDDALASYNNGSRLRTTTIDGLLNAAPWIVCNRELAAATRSHPVADQACGSRWLWLAGGWHIDFICETCVPSHNVRDSVTGGATATGYRMPISHRVAPGGCRKLSNTFYFPSNKRHPKQIYEYPELPSTTGDRRRKE